jgi:SpoVK/Ycf46/Vps4 family AAA+-type ATPase
VVECDRETLLAGYVGQSAIKTKAKIDDAKDGVLFIDEAYGLAEGGENDFGKETIEVLLKNMEDMRGYLAVIVAGYTDNMLHFLESNPGLKSRFDRIFRFNDYSPDEMMAISRLMLAKETLTPDAAAEEHLLKYFSSLFDNKDKYFGNARTVRNVVAEAVMHQNLRLAAMEPAQRTAKMIETLILEDVTEFEIMQSRQRTGVGFKLSKN